jgi:methylglutaconyl-CoA hydratase
MTANPVLWDLDARGVATVTLNRPEVNNAYDAGLINGVLAAMDELGSKPNLRVVVLKGNGKHFQAGADLKWINEVRRSSPEENLRVSRATAEAVQRLNMAPVPTVALVHGGCFGGGTGMVAACDIVLAADNAVFSIAEVRWGLHASIIIPQLADAIGVRQLRRYALTGERFDAAEAQRIGLAHQVVPLDSLAAAGEEMIARVLENGPVAMAETKALALQSAWGGFDAATLDALVDLDVMMSGPGAKNVVLMSDAGGTDAVSGVSSPRSISTRPTGALPAMRAPLASR